MQQQHKYQNHRKKYANEGWAEKHVDSSLKEHPLSHTSSWAFLKWKAARREPHALNPGEMHHIFHCASGEHNYHNQRDKYREKESRERGGCGQTEWGFYIEIMWIQGTFAIHCITSTHTVCGVNSSSVFRCRMSGDVQFGCFGVHLVIRPVLRWAGLIHTLLSAFHKPLHVFQK